jgi:hypothetical protein
MKTVEERILGAVWVLVLDGVNDELLKMDDDVPELEMRGGCLAGAAYVKHPVRGTVGLEAVERTEKERIVRLDAYRVIVTLNASERYCYRYAYALEKAIENDVTLGGIVERVLFEKKVYKKTLNGMDAVFTLRITVEGVWQ